MGFEEGTQARRGAVRLLRPPLADSQRHGTKGSAKGTVRLPRPPLADAPLRSSVPKRSRLTQSAAVARLETGYVEGLRGYATG